MVKHRDWTYKTVSCCNGCSNDCIYCYAKGDAANKKRILLQNWRHEVIRQKDVDKDYKLSDDPIMFPGTHDITENTFEACQIVLKKLLEAGNRVLLVSKPRYSLIAQICDDYKSYKNNILFRFTIGSTKDHILSFWEPNAPPYNERKSALEYASNSGYRTSVSIEPMLDADNIENLIDDLTPFINQSIWIGTMNHLWYFDIDKKDVKTDAGLKRVERNLNYFGKSLAERIRSEKQKILQDHSPQNLRIIYDRLNNKKMSDNSSKLIFWKSDIKHALGLPLPDRPEQWPSR